MDDDGNSWGLISVKVMVLNPKRFCMEPATEPGMFVVYFKTSVKKLIIQKSVKSN